MSNNKQSSIEYLIEHLLPKALTVEQYYHIEQAKAMHKEEIIKTARNYFHERTKLTPEKYYNETFEQ